MQYTLRRVPESLDAALRQRAAEEGKSLNQVVLEALMRIFGLEGEPVRQRDLADIVDGAAIDTEAESAFEEQRSIDSELWA